MMVLVSLTYIITIVPDAISGIYIKYKKWNDKRKENREKPRITNKKMNDLYYKVKSQNDLTGNF